MSLPAPLFFQAALWAAAGPGGDDQRIAALLPALGDRDMNSLNPDITGDWVRALLLAVTTSSVYIAELNSATQTTLSSQSTPTFWDLSTPGVPIDGWDFSGCPAIQWAAFHGRLSAVKLLLERGAAVDARGPVRSRIATRESWHSSSAHFLSA